jgi:RHS repeat-associated protein
MAQVRASLTGPDVGFSGCFEHWYEVRKESGQPDAVTVNYWFGGTLAATDEGGTLRFLHADHLGSSSVATNALGDVVAGNTYYPYGEHRSSTGAFGTDRDFTGQRLDTGTGLHYYNARYYGSALGRFISPDSVIPNPKDPRNWNRYVYVLGNPLKYTDPTGHECSYWGENDSCNTYESSQTAPPTDEAGYEAYAPTFGVFRDEDVEHVRDQLFDDGYWFGPGGQMIQGLLEESGDVPGIAEWVTNHLSDMYENCQQCTRQLGGASYAPIAEAIAAREEASRQGRGQDKSSGVGEVQQLARRLWGVTEMIGGTAIITANAAGVTTTIIVSGATASGPVAVGALPLVDLGVSMIFDGLCHATDTCLHVPTWRP